MAHYDFEKDLQEGQEAELRVAKIMMGLGANAIRVNRDAKYDLMVSINNRVQKLEVKHDMKSDTTGNIAIEFECRGKASGIKATEADHWVVQSKSEYLFITVASVEDMIKNGLMVKTVTGGDKGSDTQMHLFPRWLFMLWCWKRLDIEGNELEIPKAKA